MKDGTIVPVYLKVYKAYIKFIAFQMFIHSNI